MSTKQIHPNIAAAIAAAQGRMSNAVKDSTNPHFRSSFASLPAVRDVVLPAFSAEGVAVLQPIEGEPGQVTIRTILLWGEQVIECGNCTVPIASGGRNYCQDVATIATYQRRCQLAAAGGISQEDSDGEGVAPPPQQRQQPRQPQRQPQRQQQRQPQRETAPPRGEAIAKKIISEGQRPTCPNCRGGMVDQSAKRREQKAECEAGTRQKNPIPAFRCRDNSCGGIHWEAPRAAEVGPSDDRWIAQESDRNGVRP